MKKRLVITLYEKYTYRLRDLAEEMKGEGLTVTGIFDFGVITGEAEEQDMPKLSNHEEVQSLEEDREVGI